MRFEEPLVKGYAGPHLGSWGSLPVIAIGPRGGQIVGYTGIHDPIYAGSSRGHKLSAMRTEAAKKIPKKTPAVTQDEILDWLKTLGFKEADLQWVETHDKQNLTVTVSKAAAAVIQHHFKVDSVFIGYDYVRFAQKDLKPHIGKPLTPTNADESATFKAKAAAGELDKDPFPPLKDLAQTTAGKFAGSHGNLAFKSPDGRKWLFKHASQKSCRAEEAAVRLGRLLMGPSVIQAGRHVTLDGKTGVLLEVIPGSVVSGESHSTFPVEVSQKFFDQVVQHQVVDWLISNHDSHGGNWVVTPDGKLAGIDKGQAWKFLGHDKLNLEYQPNHSRQIYQNFWKQYQDGDIKGDAVKAAEAILAKIDKISDAQFLSIVGPAAQETDEPEQMASRMLDRLHSMRPDFSKFLSSVTGKQVDLVAGPKLVIPAKVSMEKPVEKPLTNIQKQSKANILHSYFEAATAVGDVVSVRWTTSGYNLVGKGHVVKQNAKSWRVKLDEPVFSGTTTWAAGQEIVVPNKLAYEKWTWNNAITPLSGAGDSVVDVMNTWAESPKGKAALAKKEAPVEIAEVAKPVILEKPEAKPPPDFKGATAGWPLTKGPVTVFNPGIPPIPGAIWPKGYPGEGFYVGIKYKGQQYEVQFGYSATGDFSALVTYPDNQSKEFMSPNAAADSLVLFQKGLPLDTSSTDKKVKYHISYPAAKAFGIQKFQDELANAHSATATEFKEKFPEAKVEDHPVAAKPSEPGESNWEWFDTHKVVHSELTLPHAQSDAAKILQSLPPDTKLAFTLEGQTEPHRFIRFVAGGWIDKTGGTITPYSLAVMIGGLSPETQVYYLVPETAATKALSANWEWFDELNEVGWKKDASKAVQPLAALDVGTRIRFPTDSGVWEYVKVVEGEMVAWKQVSGNIPQVHYNTVLLANTIAKTAIGGIEIAKPLGWLKTLGFMGEGGVVKPTGGEAPVSKPASVPQESVAELAASAGFAPGVGYMAGTVPQGHVLPVGSKKSFTENFGSATGNVKIDVEITPTGALVWVDTAGKSGPWAEGQQHIAAGFNSLSAAANWLGMLKGGYATTAEFEKAWGKKPAYNPAIVFGIKPSVYNQLVSAAEASATPAVEKAEIIQKVSFLPTTVTPATLEAAPIGQVWEWEVTDEDGTYKLLLTKTVVGYEVTGGEDSKPAKHDKPPNMAVLQYLLEGGSNYVTYLPSYAKWVGLMADVSQKDPALKNWKWVADYDFWKSESNEAVALELVKSLPTGTKLRWEVTDKNGDHEWVEYERLLDGSWKYDIPTGMASTNSATLLQHWKANSSSIPMVLLGTGAVPIVPNLLDILLSPPKTETLPLPQSVTVPKPAPKLTTKAKKVKFVPSQALALFNADMVETWEGGKAAIIKNMKAAQGDDADPTPAFAKSSKWPSWCPPPLSLIEGEYEGKKYYMGVATSGVYYQNQQPTKQAKIYVISAEKATYSGGHGIANNWKYAAKKHGLPGDLKALKKIFGLSNAVFLPGETLESVQKNIGLSAIPIASTDNVKSVAEQSAEEQQQVVKAEITFSQWIDYEYPLVSAGYDVEKGPNTPISVTLTLPSENAKKLEVPGEVSPPGFSYAEVHLLALADKLGLASGDFETKTSPNGTILKFQSKAITNFIFTDIMTKHQWASSAPVPSDDNWETMPEGYPKVISQLMGVKVITTWLGNTPKGTHLYVPNTDAVYQVEAGGVTHLGTDKFWSAKDWADLFVTQPAIKELTVVPPGVSVAEIKAMQPKIAGVGTQVPKPKPLSAEQQAKLAKAKEIAGWAQSHKVIMDPAALHVLSYLQKALPKKSIWARQGDGGKLLLGGKDSTAVQEYLHKHIKTIVDVDTPLGVLAAVTVTDLQTHFPESGMTTGPDGKEYPAGTKFETETVKTTVGEMLATEVSKVAEHKHKAETHNYLKISGTDDAAKLKLQGILDKFGLKPDGEIKAAEKYTGVGVEKSALAKVHHTTSLVKPEVPEGPPAFIAASLPSFGGDQGHRQPALSNRGDLSVLDTLALPQIGRWIWCGKHGIFDYNQVRAYKVQDHQGKTYYQVSGRLRNPKLEAMSMASTQIHFLAGAYDAKTGIRKEGTSQQFLGQYKAKAAQLDSGTIVEVVNQHDYRSFHGEFRIRIPEGADVENELGAAFAKMGLNPVEALADPDDHDRQMFIKSSIVRSFMGPAGFHIGQTQWTNEAWLDVRLQDLGADKYVATAEVSHDCQGKSVVLIHDEDEVAKNQVGFIYSGRRNRTSLVGRLLDEGLASHQSRFQAGKVGNQETLSSDLTRGGSNVTFCRFGNKKSNSPSWGLSCNPGFNMIYHPRVLQRSDWYAYNGDIFGDSSNNQWPRQDQFGNAAPSNEIDFESGMANGDLAGCVLHDEDDKEAIIHTLKGRGILEYNGIPLDKFFMVYQGASRAYVADHLYGLQPGVLP